MEIALSSGELLLREGDDPDRILPVSRESLAALLRHTRADRP